MSEIETETAARVATESEGNEAFLGVAAIGGRAWRLYRSTCAGCRRPVVIAHGVRRSFLYDRVTFSGVATGPAADRHSCPVPAR